MDIGAGNGYPSAALSNFAPHEFEIDGIKCASMEGFLQSLKFKNPAMQAHICSLVGRQAKFAGQKKSWRRTQKLYWRGLEIDRHSVEYQQLLDRAYAALSQNKGFQQALAASGNAVLGHSIGKTNPRETVLTCTEFVSRLHRLRDELTNQKRR